MIFSIGTTSPDTLTLDTFKPSKNGMVIDFHKGIGDVFFVIRVGDEIVQDKVYQDELINKITDLISDEVKRMIQQRLIADEKK
jgi:hypothetical protein